MIISATVVKKPRHVKRCAFCNGLMWHNKPRIKLSGYADKGDPLQTEYQHLGCAMRGGMTRQEARKIAQAFEQYNKGFGYDNKRKGYTAVSENNNSKDREN